MPTDYHLAANSSDRGRLHAQTVDFTGEDLVGGGTLVEAAGGGVQFQAFELSGHRVGAHIGTGAFAVVGKAHGALRVVIADCLVEQDHLGGSIVYQRGEDLAHQLVVIKRDFPELA